MCCLEIDCGGYILLLQFVHVVNYIAWEGQHLAASQKVLKTVVTDIIDPCRVSCNLHVYLCIYFDTLEYYDSKQVVYLHVIVHY